MDSKYHSLKQKLAQEAQYPLKYMYKFILPTERVHELKSYFEHAEISIKQSGKGTYSSFTAITIELSADDIINKYQSLENIKGLMSL